MKKKYMILPVLALVLVLSASIKPAWSYFTTYAEAKGGYVIQLGDTTIDEEFYDWTKHVVIGNEETAQPVYVRARAFSGSEYPLTYSGEGWTLREDGYYYYNEILLPGEETTELLVMINNVPKAPKEGEELSGETAKEGDNLHVAVIYESTPVLYDEDGNPYADWNNVLEGGN